MVEALRGIVLHTIRYNERHNIVHVYTDMHGLMSFLVPTGSGHRARERMALLMPLSLIELQARTRPNTDLATMHDVQRYAMVGAIYADPVRSAVAMFLSELLWRVIQEHERNDALYRYVESSVLALDTMEEGVANFHLWFLFNLGAHLGIEPNMETYRPGYCFNMTEGVFVPYAGVSRHILQPDRARVIRVLSYMHLDNIHRFRFTRDERAEVLDTILTYYRLHSGTVLNSLRSPDILHQLFS